MIDEILWMQKKHHDIIDNNPKNRVQQTSLEELHRFNFTPSNRFDVAPDISGNSTILTTSPLEAKTTTTDNHIIV
jgi:hypothetical protein